MKVLRILSIVDEIVKKSRFAAEHTESTEVRLKKTKDFLWVLCDLRLKKTFYDSINRFLFLLLF